MSTDSEYKKVQVGTETRFDVQPATLPFPMGGAIYLGIIFGFVALVALFGLGSGGIIILLILAAIWYLAIWGKWKRGKAGRFRYPMSFTADSSYLTVGGKKIPAADIHRFIIRNHVSDSESDFSTGGVVVAVPASVNVANAYAAARLGQAYNNKIEAVAYRLDVEAGGKATTLGCGMDETTAYGLMTDVGRILGMG